MGSRLGLALLLALTSGVGAIVLVGGPGRMAVHDELSAGDDAELSRPFIPAVNMNEDRRVSVGGAARHAGVAVSTNKGTLAATGLIRCGAATGTGQLTVRNNVITTAAHVLIDKDGRKRTGCVFEPTMAGGGPVPIDSGSIQTGSRMPLAERATRDWAVARLVAPVKGVTPYGVGSAAVPVNVTMCAGGNRQYNAMGTERCTLRRIIGTASDGIRELAIDCNAGPGSSGAALVSGHNVVGIYVGYRSTNPEKAQAFSETHYNFAISVDGPFKRAVRGAAN